MDQELHKVTDEELPILRDWLAKYIPDSLKFYGNVSSELQGRWQGTTYYTLGWPDILAVGEGQADKTKSKCADFFNDTRHTSVFSPYPEHLETLLKNPSFLDWTQPIIFQCISYANGDVVKRVSDATGTKYNDRFTCHLMMAEPGDIQPRPVPDGYELRPLDPDLHADYVTSTWPHRRNYTNLYVYELIKSFPSLGMFDKSTGEIVAVEAMTEWGFLAFLHVKEQARGRGLGKVVASHLAQTCFREDRPAYATVLTNNKPSIDMHINAGFKSRCKMDWFLHTMDDTKFIDSANSENH